MKEKKKGTLQVLQKLIEVVDGTWIPTVCFESQGHTGSLLVGLCNRPMRASEIQRLHQATPHNTLAWTLSMTAKPCVFHTTAPKS